MKGFLAVACLASCVALCIAKGPYTVSGNKVLDVNGHVHLFRGVARPGLESWPGGLSMSQADFDVMRQWGANVVRIAVSESYWFIGGGNSAIWYTPVQYHSIVASYIAMAEAAGLDVILDMHSYGIGDINSTAFWTQAATAYKNAPGVLFELLNEAHDVSPAEWKSGNTTKSPRTYGYQDMYNAVRATGAQNIVIIGGLNWAYDLTPVATYPITGSNIMYNTHPYNFPGKQQANWPTNFGFLLASHPVIATEFGNTVDCTTTFLSQFLAYANSNNMHWTAFGWWASGCAYPALFNNTGYSLANYVPTAAGAVVKSALAHFNASVVNAYVGCYIDASTRAMAGSSTSSSSMTIAQCVSYCATNNYAYAGLEYSTQCFCDNSYSKYGAAAESSCAMTCGGDASLTCGAGWRLSVYRTANTA